MNTIKELKEQFAKYNEIETLLFKMLNNETMSFKELESAERDMRRKWNVWKRNALNAIAEHCGMSKEETKTRYGAMDEVNLYFCVLSNY